VKGMDDEDMAVASLLGGMTLLVLAAILIWCGLAL